MDTLPLIGEFSLKNTSGLGDADIRRIQSGKISPNGHLWLLSDSSDEDGGGLYGFCLITGLLKVHIPINGGSFDRELEGVFFYYFDPALNPYSQYGIMHVVVLNGDLLESDNTYILHWNLNEFWRDYV